MYTANTMAAVGEAIGMSLPGSAAPPAVDRRRDGFAHRSGEAVVNLLRHGITARQVMTRKAFENAITVVMALGGSTNAVLHLLAMAREADVDLTIDDFNRIGDKVPHLGDLKPFGRYVMNDVDKVGGIPVVMKALLDAGLLHGDVMTVTGKTMGENLEELAPPGLDDDVLRSLDRPIHKTGGLTILKGSLAPDGAVVKTAGFDDSTFIGTARVFDGERAAMDALEDGHDRRRRRGGDPLRGAEGRAGDARDAGDHGRDQGRRARQGRPAGHRRALLRWYDGPVRRPHRARGGRRWTDRVRARRRPDHPRRRRTDCSRSSRATTGSRAATAGSRCRRSTRAACWPSTARWSSRLRTARSAGSRRRGSEASVATVWDESAGLIAFVATTDLERAGRFYAEVLDLLLVETTPYACVFDVDGTMLRITLVDEVATPGYTVLGLRVTDIARATGRLRERGVDPLRYTGMEQDDVGIWTTPNGDRVAWFADPDGNTVSLTQFA